jgi:tetratricopeptide (TPR) repeat protein
LKKWLLLLMLCLTRPALAGNEAVSHLLRGAQLFRTEKFDEALVEFRVAEKLGAGPEASWYAAAALVKLKRPLDALERFAQAERASSTSPDALLTYYRAVACYEAKLYRCADTLLAATGDRSGPRVAEQVTKLRNAIAAVLQKPAADSVIDWYHEQGAQALKDQRPTLAILYYQEALDLSERRPTPYRKDAAVAELERARRMASERPQ